MEIRNFEASEKSAALVGSLTKTEYITVGHYQRCEIQKVIITDLVTANVNKLVKLELTYQGNYGAEVKSAVLSFAEVDALISSLKAFQETVLPTSPAVYTEVNYTTNDFKAGCYYSQGEWTVFLKIEVRDDNSYVVVQQDTISHLIGLLSNTKL